MCTGQLQRRPLDSKSCWDIYNSKSTPASLRNCFSPFCLCPARSLSSLSPSTWALLPAVKRLPPDSISTSQSWKHLYRFLFCRDLTLTRSPTARLFLFLNQQYGLSGCMQWTTEASEKEQRLLHKQSGWGSVFQRSLKTPISRSSLFIPIRYVLWPCSIIPWITLAINSNVEIYMF